jgi:carboxypeptidase Q
MIEGFNLVTEITGAENPEQVVVMGGHIDSWDNADGAHDDGGGILGAWEAIRHINDLITLGQIPRPRRTIRVVMWTDEECGARGAHAYRDRYFDELEDTIFALESDSGHFNILGIGFTGPQAARDILEDIGARYLSDLNMAYVGPSGGGVDIEPIMQCGVPGAGVQDDCYGACVGLDSNYFIIHHTTADSGSMVFPEQLSRLSALKATYAYVVADQDVTLPHGTPGPDCGSYKVKMNYSMEAAIN